MQAHLDDSLLLDLSYLQAALLEELEHIKAFLSYGRTKNKAVSTNIECLQQKLCLLWLLS